MADRRTEDRGQRTESGGQRTEDRGRKTGDRGQSIANSILCPLSSVLCKDTYLCFDFGYKKIGAAVGQTITATASPLQTIRSINQSPDWEIISKLIEEWRPAGLVVGISRQADGSDNPITPRMLKFCRQLEGRYQLPVYQQDETLSTFEAKQMLFDEVSVKAGRLWEVQDQLAAQLILQTWLNDYKKKEKDH